MQTVAHAIKKTRRILDVTRVLCSDDPDEAKRVASDMPDYRKETPRRFDYPRIDLQRPSRGMLKAVGRRALRSLPAR